MWLPVILTRWLCTLLTRSESRKYLLPSRDLNHMITCCKPRAVFTTSEHLGYLLSWRGLNHSNSFYLDEVWSPWLPAILTRSEPLDYLLFFDEVWTYWLPAVLTRSELLDHLQLWRGMNFLTPESLLSWQGLNHLTTRYLDELWTTWLPAILTRSEPLPAILTRPEPLDCLLSWQDLNHLTSCYLYKVWTTCYLDEVWTTGLPAILTRSGPMQRRFSGFMSLWKYPCLCMKARPCSTCTTHHIRNKNENLSIIHSFIHSFIHVFIMWKLNGMNLA